MPALLNSSIEIHDSVLTAVETRAKQVKLALEAYIHKSSGIPGVDPGTGWIQNVVLTIEDGTLEGSFEKLPWDLSDGELKIGDEVFENLIPIPLDRRAPVELALMAQRTGDTVRVRGSRIQLELLGRPEYVEDFSGSGHN